MNYSLMVLPPGGRLNRITWFLSFPPAKNHKIPVINSYFCCQWKIINLGEKKRRAEAGGRRSFNLSPYNPLRLFTLRAENCSPDTAEKAV
jgi:hypothetical protein